MAASATNKPLAEPIVVTGIGMVTPLGFNASEVLQRLRAGATAIAPPRDFDASRFACPVCASIEGFRPQDFIAEAKLIRLMSRDAQLAVAAAHLALLDAGLGADRYYAPGDIGLFGATGMAGLPLREIVPLLTASTDAAGRFDLAKFGDAGLRAVSPVLSFKILGNMPVCFVSICENIQGPNAVYTPWEGHGARAIEAGILALQAGDARCVVVGACDVKTHELAFVALQQLGLFQSWPLSGTGLAPGEGAAFLVLETAATAMRRKATIHARIAAWNFHCRQEPPQSDVLESVLAALAPQQAGAVIAAANGDPALEQAETAALARMNLTYRRRAGCPRHSGPGILPGSKAAHEASQNTTLSSHDAGCLVLSPKKQLGDLFAAAAPLQVALAALIAGQLGQPALANCFGHGIEQAAFLLNPP